VRPLAALAAGDGDEKTRANAGGALGNLARNSDLLSDVLAREGVAHIAHVPLGMETIAVEAGDAAGFLSPMLEGVEPQGGDGGGVLDVKHAEHAAL
jgi:hypothetical protein